MKTKVIQASGRIGVHAQSFPPGEIVDLDNGRQVIAAWRAENLDCLASLFHGVPSFRSGFCMWRFILSFQKNQLMPARAFTLFSPRFGVLIPAQDMWR